MVLLWLNSDFCLQILWLTAQRSTWNVLVIHLHLCHHSGISKVTSTPIGCRAKKSSVQTVIFLSLRLGISGNRYRNCLACHTKKNDANALCHARNFVDNEEDLENHPRPIRPMICISPRRLQLSRRALSLRRLSPSQRITCQ
jgi:hypothetical protein